MAVVPTPSSLSTGPHRQVSRRNASRSDVTLVDLRENAERELHGLISGSIHTPYIRLEDAVGPGGVLREMASSTGKTLIYYCAHGERSAMAVQISQALGLANVCHLVGGIDAWKSAGGPVEEPATSR